MSMSAVRRGFQRVSADIPEPLIKAGRTKSLNFFDRPKPRILNRTLERNYATIANREKIEGLDLAAQKIITVTPGFTHPVFPVESEWDQPTKITIHQKKFLPQVAQTQVALKVHYFVGGLPALMQAARKLMELDPNSDEQVIYTFDGKIPKTIQSGSQAHIHPPEWASPDCSLMNLVFTLFRGMKLLKDIDPSDLKHYSYLHFPITWEEVKVRPLTYASLYMRCFALRLKISAISDKHGISPQDNWLCNEVVTESLDFHEALSEKVREQNGQPTLKRGFRVYWSPNQKAIEGKKELWQRLNIPCQWMTPAEIKKWTLLNPDSGIKVLKVIGDGLFDPLTPARIVQYLKEQYPNFSVREAQVRDLILSEECPDAIVKEINPSGEIINTPVSSFFCSAGHNEVYEKDPFTGYEKKLYEEVPVSGVSTLWRCTIDRSEIEQRLGKKYESENELVAIMEELVAAANLSNLHTTPVEVKIDGDKIKILVRATQGANFNRVVANRDDLLNMMNNIEAFYFGDWELLSVGTCTRKTNVENAPDLSTLGPGKNIHFAHSYSGIGYSASGASLDTLKKRPKLKWNTLSNHEATETILPH